MNIDRRKTNLVIAGAFNPAILTPEWIARHALNRPAGQALTVEMMAPIGFAAAPRYSFEELSYEPSFQRFTLFLHHEVEASNVTAVAAVARILELLPHTPITGIGFNFGFSANALSGRLEALMRAENGLAPLFDENTLLVNRSWSNAFTWQRSLASVQSQWDGQEAVVDINFHYEINSATEARQILIAEDAFITHATIAGHIAQYLDAKE